jgi:hypothetical protein
LRILSILLLAAGCGAVVAGAGARTLAAGQTCQTAETRVHDEAVFGHLATPAAAQSMRQKAARLGFKGIKIENDGCGDFEVEIDGADHQSDRTSFSNEAAKAGFQVTFEQIAAPLQYHVGQVVGTLARESSLARANVLMTRLASNGFRYIDLVPQNGDWLVVMPEVPVRSALSVAHEVASAGFHIEFRPGSK